MQEHIIRKEDGTIMKWNKTNDNGYFCLLHNDNKQKFTFSPTQNLKCKLFMIGGGGAGGYFFGGGGGAGSAYINDNYTFEKNKSYTFEIGTGGKCDIDNINDLFKTGLILKVFNNTTPNLTNISFSYDNYSSLGITSSGIVQSFIVNNINIPSTIFNNNTTYIWDGYIKANNDGFINVNVNSKIKTLIWVDKYVYSNDTALINDININDVKVIQLDKNKFYNIKIIAYNFDTSNTNFNILFNDCSLYHFDKEKEIYNYVPSTDTNLIYRNQDDSSYIIKCKGGGFGGCGLYNQNTNLNGGCGGGSGINKQNGKAIVDPAFNGNDGAIGTYCGGGGGIISAGNNNKGGNGQIFEWFNNELIFGAGGNGADFNEQRNLGYGCGGNGGDCCYFSKLLINNNGNNGCVLLYVNNTIEGFTGETPANNNNSYLPYDSIANKLIEESFKIFIYNDSSIPGTLNRATYFTTIGGNFATLCTNEVSLNSDATSIEIDNNNMNNFIYDMLVISKLYAVVYRLYYYQYTEVFKNDSKKFNDFLNTVYFNFDTGSSGNTKTNIIYDSTNYKLNIRSLFDITNLNLGTTTTKDNYISTIYNKVGDYIAETDLNMDLDVFYNSQSNIGTYPIPLYHSSTDGTVIAGLSNFISNENDKINKISPIGSSFSDTISGYNTNTSSISTNIFLTFNDKTLNITNIDEIKRKYSDLITDATANNADYKSQRVFLYLEQFRIILKTDPNILLNILKYKMYYYNAVVYNVILQYQLFNLQKNRVKDDYRATAVGSLPVSTTIVIASASPNINTISNDLVILKTNLDNITNIINNSDNYKEITTSIEYSKTNITNTEKEFEEEQNNYNKAINKYNNDLDLYNEMNNYYKIVIAIAITIIILIIIIFIQKKIDNNSKIGIFILIAVIIIIIYILYSNNLRLTENFTTCRFKTTGTVADLGGSIDFTNYKQTLYKYAMFILILLSKESITKNTLSPMSEFIDKANNVRARKILIYKNKIQQYKNASEILKKSINDYYYLITLIVFSIVILMVGMSLYLLYPNMLLNVVIFAVIPFIILVGYIMYKLHRSTRMIENKNYWGVYNPSQKTLQSL